jgi:hypothetical protein
LGRRQQARRPSSTPTWPARGLTAAAGGSGGAPGRRARFAEAATCSSISRVCCADCCIVLRSRGGRLVVTDGAAARRTDHAPQKRLQLTQNFGRADQRDRIGPGVRVGAALGNRLRPEPRALGPCVRRSLDSLSAAATLVAMPSFDGSELCVPRCSGWPREHRRGLVPLGSRARRRLPEHAAPGAARSVHGPGWFLWPPGGASRSMQHAGQRSGGRGCRSAGGAAARWAGLAGQRTGLLCGEERQSCRERKDQLLPLRQRAVIEAGTARGGRAAIVRQTREIRQVALCTRAQKGLSNQTDET